MNYSKRIVILCPAELNVGSIITVLDKMRLKQLFAENLQIQVVSYSGAEKQTTEESDSLQMDL
ncbi:MAG: hypothetical protein HZA84_09975 [Thaumarchaeota archaeon]|nr:hypothetical protein [Nitrososphaerota archaeon]